MPQRPMPGMGGAPGPMGPAPAGPMPAGPGPGPAPGPAGPPPGPMAAPGPAGPPEAPPAGMGPETPFSDMPRHELELMALELIDRVEELELMLDEVEEPLEEEIPMEEPPPPGPELG